TFLQKQEGKALKNIAFTCEGQIQKGEAVITRFGIEGNAIYGLSPKIQNQLDQFGQAKVMLDLKPPFSEEVIYDRLKKSKAKNTTLALRKDLNLDALKVALIKHVVSKEVFQDLKQLAQNIKALPLTLLDAAPLDEAISTTGGIALSTVDQHLQLKALPNHYCIGEMLDWNAPTGGYLLQACFSMGVYLAKHLNQVRRTLDV
ncbi:MAG: NAD(P)/FAD-dependent oxidoreductase, partial [Bacteroidota bacterium]